MIENNNHHYQSTISEGKKYIKFTSDKERKILLFTGKVEKKEVQADFEDTPGKYMTRYLLESFDITTANSEDTNGMPAIWERGTRDARTILNLLSKNFRGTGNRSQFYLRFHLSL